MQDILSEGIHTASNRSTDILQMQMSPTDIRQLDAYIYEYTSSDGNRNVIIMDADMKSFIDFIDEEEDISYWQNRIAIDPSILVGMPAIKGTRIGIDLILDLLAHGWTETEILENYPGITHEDIKACLSYASAILRRNLSKIEYLV